MPLNDEVISMNSERVEYFIFAASGKSYYKKIVFHV